MLTNPFKTVVSYIALIICLISVSTLSVADPFFITYSGTIENSDFPEVNNSEAYTATLVFDNGSANTLSQSWGESDLTCAIFTMNDAQNVQFSHDLTLQASLTVSDSATTDDGGVLSANFSYVIATPADLVSYTSVGIVLVPPVNWYMNDNNRVFHSTGHSLGFGDPLDGVQMAPSNWTNPVPYLGDCTAEGQVIEPAAPIPFAPLWVLVLLTALFMLIGARRLARS